MHLKNLLKEMTFIKKNLCLIRDDGKIVEYSKETTIPKLF